MISYIINGIHTGHVSVSDRALHYGDGVFETIAISESQPLLFDEHYQRLADGCRQLNFSPPDQQLLKIEAKSLIKDIERGVLKIIVSRGSGGRGYRSIVQEGPSRLLFHYEYPSYPHSYWLKGVKLTVCQTRLGRNPSLAGIKHLNRLEQILARSEWEDDDIADGLMLDESGDVIECTMCNVFMVKDNRLYTPSLGGCGVRGIMRQQVMKLAVQAGLPCEEENLPLNRLLSADEVFVTNSLIGIWPVQAIDTHVFSPGDATRTIMNAINRAKPPIHA